MVSTNKGNVTLYEAGQDVGAVTINDAIAKLEQVGYLIVQDIDENDPQNISTPVNGQCWYVAASPANEWVGHAGEIAIYQDGWVYRDLGDGEVFTILDDADVAVNKAGVITVLHNAY